MWQFFCGLCRNTLSLLVGVSLSMLFIIGLFGAFGCGIFGSSPDRVVTEIRWSTGT